MEQTYTIKLDSCESKPSIIMELKQVPQNRLQRAMDFAIKAFRQVEVNAEETGEVIFNYYKDFEWFSPHLTMAKQLICCVIFVMTNKSSQQRGRMTAFFVYNDLDVLRLNP